jgi:hypothetical protein
MIASAGEPTSTHSGTTIVYKSGEIILKGKKATCKSDWEARDDAELTIRAGDEIVVRGYLDSAGWAEGQIGDRVGWFPLQVLLPPTHGPLPVSLR